MPEFDLFGIMESFNDIAAGVIETEIEGLAALGSLLRNKDSALAHAVNDAVARLAGLQGRIILTGMGKSGHVARKIAATFASTGAAAVFVHPAEASHGDLGMITDQDMILALSNSGETEELRDILAYARRFAIPLIVMTSGAGSTLAQAGDVCLLLPAVKEAGATTPAPTTTTTMMMALGDALAVALLRENGVTARDFQAFHPGGRLGAALKRVTDLMHHREMPLCGAGDDAETAIRKITSGGFGCVGIVDSDGALVGIVTDGDLRRHLQKLSRGAKVTEIMTKDPHVVQEESVAAEALALFSDRKITAVFIVDEDRRPLGLLHVHDCLEVGVL